MNKLTVTLTSVFIFSDMVKYEAAGFITLWDYRKWENDIRKCKSDKSVAVNFIRKCYRSVKFDKLENISETFFENFQNYGISMYLLKWVEICIYVHL